MTASATPEVTGYVVEALVREGDAYLVPERASIHKPDLSYTALMAPRDVVAFRFLGNVPIVFEDGTVDSRQNEDGLYETGWFFLRHRIFDYLDPEAIAPLKGRIRSMIDAALEEHRCTHLIVLAPGQFRPFRPGVDQLEPKFY